MNAELPLTPNPLHNNHMALLKSAKHIIHYSETNYTYVVLEISCDIDQIKLMICTHKKSEFNLKGEILKIQ